MYVAIITLPRPLEVLSRRGEVALQIESPSEEVRVLPLDPCEVALADLEWEQQGETTPARIGSDSQGRLFLFVRGSGHQRPHLPGL